MQERMGAVATPRESSLRRAFGGRIGLVAALTMLCSAFVPGVPILVGVLLVIAVALHVWTPELQPFLQPILRVPVATAGRRRARLLLVAAVGGLLVVSGAVGATTRGHLRGRWDQDQRRREIAEQDATRLMQRIEEHLAGGDVQAAELALMEVERIVGIDDGRRAEFDKLHGRMRRAGDARAILEVLVGLPSEAFAAFETNRRVPAEFEFPERALTMRAVEIALAQLEDARRLRAGH